MANSDLKLLAKENGVFLWQIADALKIADGNLSRKLRRELLEKEKEKIRGIIGRLSGGGGNDGE